MAKRKIHYWMLSGQRVEWKVDHYPWPPDDSDNAPNLCGNVDGQHTVYKEKVTCAVCQRIMAKADGQTPVPDALKALAQMKLTEPVKFDPVEKPAHYNQGGIECIDALKVATTGLDGIEAVCTANAIKYLWRHSRKNGTEDLRKAIWYIEHLIKVREERGAK